MRAFVYKALANDLLFICSWCNTVALCDCVIGDSGWSYVGAWVLLGGSGSLEREGEGAKINRKIYICILWTHTDEVWLPRREIKRGI